MSLKICVVIPAHNEQHTIRNVVFSVCNYVKSIIVVDDGSTDNTLAILKHLPVFLIVNKKNRGYAKALESGLMSAFKAGADYAISFDADGQHQGPDLKKVIEVIKKFHPDFVLGKRSKKNRIMELFFGIYSQKKCGFSDPLCGIKAYKKLFFQKYGYLEKSYTIGTELIFCALSNKSEKVNYKEVDIKIKKRLDNARFGNSIKGNWLEFLALTNIIRRFGF